MAMRANKPALHSKASHFSRLARSRSRYKPDGGRSKTAMELQRRILDLATHHPEPVPEPHPTPDALTPVPSPLPPPLPLAQGTPATRPRIRACDIAVVAAIALALASLAVYLLMR
jgi:hypothetical protein